MVSARVSILVGAEYDWLTQQANRAAALQHREGVGSGGAARDRTARNGPSGGKARLGVGRHIIKLRLNYENNKGEYLGNH